MNPILSCFPLKSTDTGDDSEDSTDLSDIDSDMEDDLPAVNDILPISSDEEAELESQRIHISDLFRKTLPEKVHGLISHSNGSAASVEQEVKKEPQKQQTKQKQKKPVVKKEAKNKHFTIKFETTTGKRKKTTQQKIQEHKNKKIKVGNSVTDSVEKSAILVVSCSTEDNDTLQVATTCKPEAKLNSSIICGLIFASSETHMFKFQCQKCDKLMHDIDSFSKHQHDIHAILTTGDFSSDLASKDGTVNVETLRADKDVQCGEVELVNGKKLCFKCVLCKEGNYIDWNLFRCHLKERHTYFVTGDCNDVTNLQRVEVKGEVYIIKHIKKSVDKAKEIDCVELNVSTSLPVGMATTQKNAGLTEDFSEVNSLPIPAPDTPPPENDDFIKNHVSHVPVKQNSKIEMAVQTKNKKSITKKSTNQKQNKSKDKTAIVSAKKTRKNAVKSLTPKKPTKLATTEKSPAALVEKKVTTNTNLKQTTLFDMKNFTKISSTPTGNPLERSKTKENLPKRGSKSKLVDRTSLPAVEIMVADNSAVIPKDLTQQGEALPVDDKMDIDVSADVHNDLKQKSTALPVDDNVKISKNLALSGDNKMADLLLSDASNDLKQQTAVFPVNNEMHINILSHVPKNLKQTPPVLPIDNKVDVDMPLDISNVVDKMDDFMLQDSSKDIKQQSVVLSVTKENNNVDMLSDIPKNSQRKYSALDVDNKVDVDMLTNLSSMTTHANNAVVESISSDSTNELTQPTVSTVKNDKDNDMLSHIPRNSKHKPSTLALDKKVTLPLVNNISDDMQSHSSNNIIPKPPSPPESIKNFEQVMYVITELNENSTKPQTDVAKTTEKSTKRPYTKRKITEPSSDPVDLNKQATKPFKRTYTKKVTNKNRLTCEICQRTFKKNSRLAEHKRLHTGEKPYDCDICNKSFRIKRRLTEHKMRHRKEKTFKCEKCELAFVLKQDYTLHMRHHTGDRRHQCTICSKAFVRSVDLTIHTRVHTGEKPFACEICGRSFRANQNLFVHRRSHLGEKNFKCEHCDKTFLRNIDRKVHMRTHTGERPFKCEICGRGYSSRVHVRSHIQREHMVNDTKKKTPTRKPKAKTKKKVDQEHVDIEENGESSLETISNKQPTQLTATVVRKDSSEDIKNLLDSEPKLEKGSEPKLEKDLSINYFKPQVSVTLSMQVEKLPVMAVPKNENDTSILTNANTTPSALARK